MKRPAANAPCPCGSGKKAKGCCLPVLEGTPAPTPEALMRSRYTAYVSGDVSHIQRTTHASGPHFQADSRAWAEELRAYCAAVVFSGLRVEESTETGLTGTVTFRAAMTHQGADRSFGEKSRFVKEDGRWFYVDGSMLPDVGRRLEAK